MEKLLYFWVDISHKRATNSTGIRANWINCLLYILKVLLNLHNFPLLNRNCTELYLGPLYRSYILVQILNCKVPERVLLNGAIWKRFSKVSKVKMCGLSPLASFYPTSKAREQRPGDEVTSPCLRTSAWEATYLCTQGIIVEPSITLISVPHAHARWTRAAILSRKPSYSSE